MNGVDPWGWLPEIVETLERSYGLLKTAILDLRQCLREREKSKTKEAVLKLRGHVGEVDAVLSRLRAKMQMAVARNDTTGFKMHRDEIARIHGLVVNAGNELMDAMIECQSYLNGYPKLRDALNLKLETEHVMEDEPEIYQDLTKFTWWVNYSADATRKALEMLNKHLKSEYET